MYSNAKLFQNFKAICVETFVKRSCLLKKVIVKTLDSNAMNVPSIRPTFEIFGHKDTKFTSFHNYY